MAKPLELKKMRTGALALLVRISASWIFAKMKTGSVVLLTITRQDITGCKGNELSVYGNKWLLQHEKFEPKLLVTAIHFSCQAKVT